MSCIEGAKSDLWWSEGEGGSGKKVIFYDADKCWYYRYIVAQKKGYNGVKLIKLLSLRWMFIHSDTKCV